MTIDAEVARKSFPAQHNLAEPYVGPQPFEARHASVFFGRTREAEDIVSLVLAHQVVLIYSPSGAGKSSVINAQVVPTLRDRENCAVWSTRVKGPFPECDRTSIQNVYMFQALSLLAADDPQNRFPEVRILFNTTLVEFLRELGLPEWEPDADAEPDNLDQLRVLVIDQFEELFTTLPEYWPHREGFFRQLRVALDDDPNLRVLIAMREEYLANFEPFAAQLPGRGKCRFPLGRLKSAAALQAVAQPAAKFRTPFASGVSEHLVDKLMHVQEPTDSGSVSVRYEYVEPLQLQVVCRNLWGHLEPGAHEITADHVEKHGNVEQALRQFYRDTVSEVVTEVVGQSEAIDEFTLRQWFEEELITPTQTRGLAQDENGFVAGLPLEVVRRLENHHLLKVEVRGPANWYEITHDRLIGPILTDNFEWRKSHSWKVFVRRLRHWIAEHRAVTCMALLLLIAVSSGILLTARVTWLAARNEAIAEANLNLARTTVKFYVKEARGLLDASTRDAIDAAGAGLLLSEATKLATEQPDALISEQLTWRLALADQQVPSLAAMHCDANLDLGETRFEPMTFSPDARLLAVRTTTESETKGRIRTRSASKQVTLFAPREGRTLTWEPGKAPVHCLFSPDSQHVVALRDGALDVYEVIKTGQSVTLKFRRTVDDPAREPGSQTYEFAKVIGGYSQSNPHECPQWWIITERKVGSVTPENNDGKCQTEVAVWVWNKQDSSLALLHRLEKVNRQPGDAITLSDTGTYLALLIKNPADLVSNAGGSQGQTPPNQQRYKIPNHLRIVELPSKQAESSDFEGIDGSNQNAQGKNSDGLVLGDWQVPCEKVDSMEFRPSVAWPLLVAHRSTNPMSIHDSTIRLISPPLVAGEPRVVPIPWSFTRVHFSSSGSHILIVDDRHWLVARPNWDENGGVVAVANWTEPGDPWQYSPNRRMLDITNQGVLESTIMSEAFSPDGRFLTMGSRDRFARVYDLDIDRQVYGRFQHSGTVGNIAFSEDGRELLTVDTDYQGKKGTARIWELANETSHKIIPLASPPRIALGAGRTYAEHFSGWELVGGGNSEPILLNFARALSGDGSAAAQVATGKIRGFDLPALTTTSVDPKSGTTAWIDPAGTLLLVAGAATGSTIYVPNSERSGWEKAGELELKDQHENSIALPPISRAAFGGKKKRLVTTHNNPTNDEGFATVWDLSDIQTGSAPKFLVRATIWRDANSQSRTPLSGSVAGDEQIGSPAIDAATDDWGIHRQDVTSLAISDEGWLVTGSEDDTARVWDLSTLESVALLGGHNGHTANISDVAFQPAQQLPHILTASADGHAKLWNFRERRESQGKDEGQVIAEIAPGRAVLTTAAFNHDGTLIATAGEDSKLSLWHVPSPDQKTPSMAWLTTIQCEGVRRLRFTPDSKALVALTSDYRKGDALVIVSIQNLAISHAQREEILDRVRRIGLREMDADDRTEPISIVFEKALKVWGRFPAIGNARAATKTANAADWHVRQAQFAESTGNWNAVLWHLTAPELQERFSAERDLLAMRIIARARLGLPDEPDAQVKLTKLPMKDARYSDSVLHRVLAEEYAEQFYRLTRQGEPGADRTKAVKQLALDEYARVIDDSPAFYELAPMGQFAAKAEDKQLFDRVLEAIARDGKAQAEQNVLPEDALKNLGYWCLEHQQNDFYFAIDAYEATAKFNPDERMNVAYPKCLALLAVARLSAMSRGEANARQSDTVARAMEDYRKSCDDGIAQSEAANDTITMNGVAWSCLLDSSSKRADNPGTDTRRDWKRIESALQLALKCFNGIESTNQEDRSMVANTIGVAYYRLGDFENAVKYLELSDSLPGRTVTADIENDSYNHGNNLLFLALTHKASNENPQMTQRWDEFNKWHRRNIQNPNARQRFSVTTIVELNLFLQEAESAGLRVHNTSPILGVM
jgi:WD40 repeat protein